MKTSLLAIGAILVSAGAAQAKFGTSNHEVMSASGSQFGIGPVQAERAGDQTVIDISGIETWDELGNPNNTVIEIDMADLLGKAPGSPVIMNGIGWNTNQTAGLPGADASWLSEMTLYFDDNINPDGTGLILRPGAGSDGPGTASFDSGGVIKLADASIPDIVLPNGILRIEFYESFVDTAGVAEGIFNQGSTITVQTVPNAPAPGALALLGLAGVAARRRRRS